MSQSRTAAVVGAVAHTQRRHVDLQRVSSALCCLHELSFGQAIHPVA
jgi:hypothetical protein